MCTQRLVRKGSAVVGIITVVVILALAAVVLLPAIGTHHTHCGSRQLKDSTQIRGLHQGMVTWAQDHPTPPADARGEVPSPLP